MPTSIHCLLFDVEGVIARPDRAAADRRLAALAPGLDAARLHEARNRPETYPLWQDYSRGHMGRYAYWRAIVEALGFPPDPEHVVEMLDIQTATCWRDLDLTMLALLDRLLAEDRLRLGLLSNSAPDHEAFIPRFEGRFHVAHFSHRTGRRKPDPEAYREVLAALGTEAEQVLFIDDKPRNTEAAAALGMQVWDYQAFEPLLAELRSRGLVDEGAAFEAGAAAERGAAEATTAGRGSAPEAAGASGRG